MEDQRLRAAKRETGVCEGIGKVDVMVSVERVVWRKLGEEGAFACGEDVVEIDAYCTCIECRIAWW